MNFKESCFGFSTEISDVVTLGNGLMDVLITNPVPEQYIASLLYNTNSSNNMFLGSAFKYDNQTIGFHIDLNQLTSEHNEIISTYIMIADITTFESCFIEVSNDKLNYVLSDYLKIDSPSEMVSSSPELSGFCSKMLDMYLNEREFTLDGDYVNLSKQPPETTGEFKFTLPYGFKGNRILYVTGTGRYGEKAIAETKIISASTDENLFYNPEMKYNADMWFDTGVDQHVAYYPEYTNFSLNQANGHLGLHQSMTLEKGRTYTLSFEAKANEFFSSPSNLNQIQFGMTTAGAAGIGENSMVTPALDVWELHSYTFVYAFDFDLVPVGFSTWGIKNMDIRNMKLLAS